jgi:hypothetical protein
MNERDVIPEAEWLAYPSHEPLMRQLGDKVGIRKRHLFACGCCRTVWSALSDEGRDALQVAERFVNGEVREQELQGARYRTSAVSRVPAAVWAAEAVSSLFSYLIGNSRAFSELTAHAARASRDTAGESDWSAARIQQVGLVCDLLGHLLRSFVVDPAWLRWNDGTVLKLARAIYDENQFGDLPILADALEEAGCDNEDILAHCRSQSLHVRGCWVIDAILDKK